MNTSRKAAILVVMLIAAVAATSAYANSGDLYVSDNDAIHKFAPNGVHTIFATLSRPRGLAFDKKGNLFAATLDTGFHDNQGRILKFASDGSSSLFVAGNGPEGIAFHNSNGNLFANFTDPTGTFNSAIVQKIAPSGDATTLATISDAAEFTHLLFSLVFDDQHNLFVADQFANSIFIITSSGRVATYASVASVQALAFDAEDNLYVGDGGPANGGSGNITKITPAGSQSTFAIGVGDIRGLAFDASGNLFGTGHGNNVVYKISPSGTVTIFATGLNVPQFLAFEP